MRWACGSQVFDSEFRQSKMSINTFLSIASLLGFEGVEFSGEHLPSTRPNYAQILRELMKEHEISSAIINYHVKAPENLISLIEPIFVFAKELRSRLICLSGPTDWTPFFEALKELAELSERFSLPLGLSLPMRIGSAEALCNLLDEIASPYLTICMEVSSEITPKDEFWQDLVKAAPFTLHVHLHISDLAKALTWLPVLEPLREVEYDGFISLVKVPEPVEESLQALSSQFALIER